MLTQFDYDLVKKIEKEYLITDSSPHNVASLKHIDNLNPAMNFNPVTVLSAQKKQSAVRDSIECLANHNVNRLRPELLDNYTMREKLLYYA